MNRSLVVFALGFAALGVPPRTPPQEPALDSGVFDILRDSTVIGREEFALRGGRRLSANSGFTISARALYPPDRPTLRVSSVIEFGPDSQPTTGQIEVADGEAKRLLVAVERRRITVRTITPTGESARQYPTTSRTLIVDPALVSSFALLPQRGAPEVAILEPRELQRVLANLVDRGMDQTVVDRASQRLRHFTLGAGPDVRHLWFDVRGRLRKLEVPGSGITAIRVDSEGL